jgi:hypothetical protein
MSDMRTTMSLFMIIHHNKIRLDKITVLSDKIRLDKDKKLMESYRMLQKVQEHPRMRRNILELAGMF